MPSLAILGFHSAHPGVAFMIAILVILPFIGLGNDFWRNVMG
jgi:hypothetical protein